MTIHQAIMQACEIDAQTSKVLAALADYVTEQPIGLSSLQIDEDEIVKAKRKILDGFAYLSCYVCDVLKQNLNEWEHNFVGWLWHTEFTMGHDNAGYFLDDLQGANLGNINQDRFESAAQIFDRMGIYIEDYLNTPLCESADELGVDTSDVHDLEDWLKHKDQMPDCEWDMSMVDMICNHTKDIDLDKVVTFLNAR